MSKKTEAKDRYTPPRSEVLEMTPEGVIAASELAPGSYNPPFSDGGSWNNG